MRNVIVILCCLILAAKSLLAQQGRIDTTAPHNGFRNVMTYDAHDNKVSDIEQELLNGKILALIQLPITITIKY